MNSPDNIPAATLPSGARMPLIGFGTWKLRGQQAHTAVLAALKTGYRHLDTATMYGNESEVGQALRDSGLSRDQVFVTTKIRPGDAGRARSVLDASLRALDTDYLDLWLVHWPPRAGQSRRLWKDMIAFRDEGLVRDIGVSNYKFGEIDDLAKETGQTPAVNQIHWNPARYDAATLAGHADRGIAVEGYSPLKDTRLSDPVLSDIAAAHDVTPAQVVLRWHLEHDITVIPKSSQPARIAANLDLVGFSLTSDEVARIDGLAGH
jgi:diketogulonate reductase-like aldo/keto reductase